VASSRSSQHPPDSGSSLPGNTASERLSGAPLASAAATVTATVGDDSSSGATVWNGPSSAAPAYEHTATYGQGVEVSAERLSAAGAPPKAGAHALSKRMLYAAILAPLVLLAVLWAVSEARRDQPPEGIVAAPPHAMAPQRPAATESLAQPVPAATVSEIPVVEPSTLPLMPSTAPPVPRRFPRAAPRAAPPKPTPEPLDNPY
jgi:hypothetical protein